jgi:hypothetical protein
MVFKQPGSSKLPKATQIKARVEADSGGTLGGQATGAASVKKRTSRKTGRGTAKKAAAEALGRSSGVIKTSKATAATPCNAR